MAREILGTLSVPSSIPDNAKPLGFYSGYLTWTPRLLKKKLELTWVTVSRFYLPTWCMMLKFIFPLMRVHKAHMAILLFCGSNG